jgi:hypothetical protein
MNALRRFFVVVQICAVPVALLSALHAETLHVHCGAGHGIKSITQAITILQQSGSLGPKTIVVSGDCKENVLVQSMDNLTISGQGTGSITDASGGAADLMDIQDSRRIVIDGLTFNGGANGVVCTGMSTCRFSGDTIRDSAGIGVFVSNAQARLDQCSISNNAFRGLNVVNGAVAGVVTSTLQGNGDGIVVIGHGTVALVDSAVNGSLNRGILAIEGSAIRLQNSSVTGSAGDGVSLQQSSQARLESFAGANSITGNGGAGVTLSDLSFAFFDVGSNVNGNAGGTDVVCLPQFSATRGATTNLSSGTTNCVEP